MTDDVFNLSFWPKKWGSKNRKGNFLNQWQEKQNVLAKATCQ